MGFQTGTSSIRIDDEELRLRQMVVELRNKKKDPRMIRDYLQQYQGYKPEAIANAFEIAGMKFEQAPTTPIEPVHQDTWQQPQQEQQAQGTQAQAGQQQMQPQAEGGLTLGGMPFKIESTADYTAWKAEQDEIEAKKIEAEKGITELGLTTSILDNLNSKIEKNEGFSAAIGLQNPFVVDFKGENKGKGRAGTEAAGFQAVRDQLLGKLTVDARGKLKGQGTITDVEMAMLASAETALNNPNISQKEFINQIGILKAGLEDRIKRLKDEAASLTPGEQTGGGQTGGEPITFNTPEEARTFLQENPNAPGIEEIQAKLDEYDKKKDLSSTGESQGFDEVKSNRYSDILGDLGEDFSELAIGMYESAGNRFNQGKNAMNVGAPQNPDKEAAFSDKAIRVVGAMAGFGADTIGEFMKFAVKGVSTPEDEKKIKELVEKVGAPIMQSKTVEGIMANYEDLKENDPGAAANMEALFNIIDFGSEFTGGGLLVGLTRRAGKEGAEQTIEQTLKQGSRYVREAGSTKSVLKEGLEEGVEQGAKQGPGVVRRTATATNKFAGDTALAVTERATGLPSETIQRMVKNPEKFTPEEMAKVTRDATFNKVDNAISKRIADLSETGAGYDILRNSGDIVNVDKNFLVDTLRDAFKFDIVDGQAVATTKSLTRESSDINAINKFLKTWGDVDVMDADEFLNMRADLANLAKYDKISGKTGASETIAKRLRADLNAKYRNQIDGLEQLDTKFAPEKSELDAIKKDYFNADGSIKSNAYTRLATLTNNGKEQQLKRLKKIIPGIEEEVNMLKAVENIRGLSANQAGQYVRSALTLGAGGLITGGGPGAGIGAVVGLLLANPSSAVSIIRNYGKLRNFKNSVILRTIDKMKTGQKLTPGEKSLVNKAIDNAEETLQKRNVVERAFDNMKGKGGLSMKEVPLDPDDSKALMDYIDEVRLKRTVQGSKADDADYIFEKLGISTDKTPTALALEAEKILDGTTDSSSLYKTGRPMSGESDFSSPAVGQTALIKEAKNYKTADEFVKAQGTPLYHGTDVDFKEFSAEKFSQGAGGDMFGRGVYLTDNKKIADGYATHQGGNIIKRVKIPENIKLFDIGAKPDKSMVDSIVSSLKKTFPDAMSDPVMRRDIAYHIKNNDSMGGILEIIEIDLKNNFPQYANKFSEAGDEVFEAIRKSGFDGIKYNADTVANSGLTGTNYVIFDVKNTKILDESQLTDIWNKANNR